MRATGMTLLFAAGLLVLLTACDEVGPLPRCQAVVDYLEQCEPSCPRPGCSVDGEGAEVLHLDAVDATELGDFDACIVCLGDEAAQGRCTDCQVEGRDGETCLELLGRVTGLGCL